MLKKITTQYTLLYPADIQPRVLAFFFESFTLLEAVNDLKFKKATITFCREHTFVVRLGVEERIAEYWRDIIVYDLDKIEIRTDLEVKVILLEELVHCYVDTLDEKVTGLIVASLIPEISFDIDSMSYRNFRGHTT